MRNLLFAAAILSIVGSIAFSQSRVRKIPDMEPLVGQLIDITCIPRHPIVSHLTFVFAQSSQEPMTNYQDTGSNGAAEFDITVFSENVLIQEFRGEGERRNGDRFSIIGGENNMHLRLNLSGVVEGAGMLIVDGPSDLSENGFFSESVVCDASVQAGDD